jgi:hypothetical protein
MAVFTNSIIQVLLKQMIVNHLINESSDFFKKVKILHYVHRTLSLDHILIHLNSVNTLASNVRFILILSFNLHISLPNDVFTQGFQLKFCIHISFHNACCITSLTFPDLLIRTILDNMNYEDTYVIFSITILLHLCEVHIVSFGTFLTGCMLQIEFCMWNTVTWFLDLWFRTVGYSCFFPTLSISPHTGILSSHTNLRDLGSWYSTFK